MHGDQFGFLERVQMAGIAHGHSNTSNNNKPYERGYLMYKGEQKKGPRAVLYTLHDFI